MLREGIYYGVDDLSGSSITTNDYHGEVEACPEIVGQTGIDQITQDAHKIEALTLIAPDCFELREKTETSFRELEALKRERDNLALPEIQAIKERIGKELGIPSKEQADQELRQSVNTEIIDLNRQWINDVFDGRYGLGELAFVKIGYNEGKYRLARVLTPQQCETDKGYHRFGYRDNVMNPEVYVQLCQQNTNYYEIDKYWSFEINPDSITQDEVDKFVQTMLAEGTSIDEIFSAVPNKFIIKLEAGRMYTYGGCDHHSGKIDGYALALPTGRFAVLSYYSGERENIYMKYSFWGITSDPRITPRWSASGARWTGEKLEDPTDEELMFFHKQVTVPKHMSIETDKHRDQ